MLHFLVALVVWFGAAALYLLVDGLPQLSVYLGGMFSGWVCAMIGVSLDDIVAFISRVFR